MDSVFVRASFTLTCDWEGLPPVYRIYVNDELFTERTWDFVDFDLQETLQIQAPPGRYSVRVESVPPHMGSFDWLDHRVEHGAATWTRLEKKNKSGLKKEMILEINTCEPENS